MEVFEVPRDQSAFFDSLDHLRESCGVFGIFGDKKAAEKAFLGIYALQHRGQESAGIAASNGKIIALHKGTGLVRSVFASQGIMAGLKGASAIGHNRYSTTGASQLSNAQPLMIRSRNEHIAIAHNGNLVNAIELRGWLDQSGAIFQTTSDSEIILHLVAKSGKASIEDRIIEALSQVAGSYCFLFLTPSKLIAARDPYGFRPLCLGRSDNATIVASESCALDICDVEYLRDIEPGEVLIIEEKGLTSMHLPVAQPKAFCIFEYIYFSRPDSVIFGVMVDKVRRNLGKKLAEEASCNADIVIAVPDSANTAALGYAKASGTRFEIGLIRNHYVGRTFIAPHQNNRDLDVKVKFNPVSGVLKGKRVVVVEDSIVRGTTLRHLVRLIRDAGAAEVHVRVSSPPVKFPCFYGIDISSRGELIAASCGVEEICKHIGADSLSYLSVQGMLDVVPERNSHCTACFTGEYPTGIPENFCKDQFSL